LSLVCSYFSLDINSFWLAIEALFIYKNTFLCHQLASVVVREKAINFFKLAEYAKYAYFKPNNWKSSALKPPGWIQPNY